MKPARLFACLCLFFLVSCDPGYRLMVNNYSIETKQIQVLMPADWSVHDNDSIYIYTDSSFRSLARIIIKQKKQDSLLSGYFFQLAPKEFAIVSQGMGKPYKFQIIVKNIDSIIQNKFEVKRKWMSNDYKISIRQ